MNLQELKQKQEKLKADKVRLETLIQEKQKLMTELEQYFTEKKIDVQNLDKVEQEYKDKMEELDQKLASILEQVQ